MSYSVFLSVILNISRSSTFFFLFHCYYASVIVEFDVGKYHVNLDTFEHTSFLSLSLSLSLSQYIYIYIYIYFCAHISGKLSILICFSFLQSFYHSLESNFELVVCASLSPVTIAPIFCSLKMQNIGCDLFCNHPLACNYPSFSHGDAPRH